MHEVKEKLSIVELQLNGFIRKLNEVIVINKRLEAENKRLKAERDNAISQLNSNQLDIFGAARVEDSSQDLDVIRKEVAQCLKDIDNCLMILENKS